VALIEAPPDRLWQLVSDITLMPMLSDELQSVRWADGFAGPKKGAVFLGVNLHPAMGEWTTKSTVTVFRPPTEFSWAVGDPNRPAAIWRFELIPHTRGTSLRYTARIGPGRSGVSMMIDREPNRAQDIVAERLRQFERNMSVTVAGLKALAESR
jgi:Polyketide cyclase / dehydrase and lipid transport